MLNYIWISLIAIGIFVATGTDIYNESQNSFRGGVELETNVKIIDDSKSDKISGDIEIEKNLFNQFYNKTIETKNVKNKISILTQSNGSRTIIVPIDESSPKVWRDMSAGAKIKNQLSGDVKKFEIDSTGKNGRVVFILEKISFLKTRAITQAAFDYSIIAVDLALGLIGIMALWLGIMAIADKSGVLLILTKLLTPLTKKLFPDIPSDHPAIGAMIMNISANMLGLNNAATPLGLKAMEELNKLNPKLGTATNSMCTFLVINTSGLTLIPATVIAIRASMGSSDPGIIIGTSIFGAACATIAGITAVKILQRLPRYNREEA